MALRFSILFFLAFTALAPAQSSKSTPVNSAADKKFVELMTDVRNLAAAQQNEEALKKLREAEAIKPNSPEVQTARGNLYTNTKEYDKARECYMKADALRPGGFEPRFNLTELDYVQGNYKEAADSFAKLLTSEPNLPAAIRTLMHFKIIVCALKLQHVAQAQQLEQTYAFKEDTPAHYFTKAAFAVQKGDNATAGAWMERAQKAFQPRDIAPYMDALVEAHWLTIQPAADAKK